MEPNFLPPTPIKDSSDKWRNVMSIFVLGLAVAGGLGYEYIGRSLDVGERVAVAIEQAVTGENDVGGDVVVEPPVIEKPKVPELVGERFDLSVLSAQAVMVKDAESGAVLLEHNAYVARPIASVTKLMSALVTLEKDIDWEKRATVVGADSLGTHMYAGDTYTMQELWDASLVGSSNKAIKSLANALDWPEVAFIERMNQKAQELGMSSTRFTDTTGLDSTDVASASDIVILLDEALRKEKIKESVNLSEVNLYSNERQKAHHMYTTNWLLLGWIPHEFHTLVGGKTGYTPEAGWNFVMQVEDEAGRAINVVVLGTDSHEARFTESRDVAQWAFDNYRWPGEEAPIVAHE